MCMYMVFIGFFAHKYENKMFDFQNIFAQTFNNIIFVDFPTLFSVEINSIFIADMAALFNGSQNSSYSAFEFADICHPDI